MPYKYNICLPNSESLKNIKNLMLNVKLLPSVFSNVHWPNNFHHHLKTHCYYQAFQPSLSLSSQIWLLQTIMRVYK